MVDVSAVGDGLFLLIQGVFLIHVGDGADRGGLFTAAGEQEQKQEGQDECRCAVVHVQISFSSPCGGAIG